jgi:hypothetical protein
MRGTPRSPDADQSDGRSYRETIDEANSAIRARGHLDRLAVDLLCGTIEQLCRRGHTDIAVTIELPGTVDPCARPALAAMAERLASRQGRLSFRVGRRRGPDYRRRVRRRRPARTSSLHIDSGPAEGRSAPLPRPPDLPPSPRTPVGRRRGHRGSTAERLMTT